MENKNNYEQEVSEAKYSGLHIQEGDVLEIVVSGFDEIAVRPFNLKSMSNTSNVDGNNLPNSNNISPSEYAVSTEGSINFPVLGDIFCKGMTKLQLKNDIESRLKKYLTDPLVTVKLQNFNISILGEVKSPGQKTSPTEKLNLFQAISLAGDMTDAADRTKVKLIRYSEAEGKDKVIPIDFSDGSIINSPYYYLQQNDILYIEPDQNKKIVANSTNPNRSLWFQIGGVTLGLVTLILSLTR